jgi:hypothetical protein
MGPLLFRCPTTANIIYSQIETNTESIASSRDSAMRIYCPHCKREHELPISAGVVDEPADRAAGAASHMPPTQ